MPNPIYALILAGGSGERFWPLSRRARPKQLLRLVSDKTLLEETLGRLEGLVAPDRTLILTNTEQESAVRKLLGGFPKENIIAEPAKRDTAAAVALGTGWVVARDHAATMLVLPADHVIHSCDGPLVGNMCDIGASQAFQQFGSKMSCSPAACRRVIDLSGPLLRDCNQLLHGAYRQ